MNSQMKNFFLFPVLLFFVLPSQAQENDSTLVRKDNLKIIEAKDIPLDTTALDMKGVEQMELMDTETPLNDNPLVLIKRHVANHFEVHFETFVVYRGH